jgi:hypothetical protein
MMRKNSFAAMAALITLAACGSVQSIEEDSGAPDAAGSLPDAPPECVTECVSASTLRDCQSGGQLITCSLGCDAAEEPRCRELVPSNGLDISHIHEVSSVFVVEEGVTAVLNTDSGEITGISSGREPGTGVNNGIRFQFLDNGLTVFGVQEMDIQGTIRATGARPLVILSAGDARVSGTVNVSAGMSGGYNARRYGGAGGGNGAYGTTPATGCAPGANGNNINGNSYYPGGGGGGLGLNGAAGGASSDADEPGGAGGEISACPDVTLVPLQGGSGGGRSGYLSYGGGGGGGAVQITSYSRISIDGGTIAAAGSGGDGYGGGGGSGGAILLEAPFMSLSNATLAANGGGGGGSSSYTGADGRLDEQPAAGGSYGGGRGGSLLASAQPGTTSGDGGGGGGAVGIVRLNVPFMHLSMSDSLASPAETRGDPTAE